MIQEEGGAEYVKRINEKEMDNVRYVGMPVAIITLSIICHDLMGEYFFSETIAVILNILRDGNSCQVILEGESSQKVIDMAYSLKEEVQRTLSPSPAINEYVIFTEDVSHRSKNPNDSETYKKSMLMTLALDFQVESTPKKQNIFHLAVQRIKKAFKPSIVD